MVLEAVRLYVQSLSSYRNLARIMEHRLGEPVGRVTLNTWVDRVASMALTPLEMSAMLGLDWGGYLGVDGKAIFIKGVEHQLLAGVDQNTHDVVHCLIVKEEHEEGYERLVRESVTVAGYPLKGLIHDASKGFVSGWQKYFARVPLQLCRIHFSRNLDADIAKGKHSPTAPVRAEFKDRIRGVLFAATVEEAAEHWYSLIDDRVRYQGLSRSDTLASLHTNFGLYMTHHRVPGLPADANITENVIKQLGKKLRLMEGFATVASAERFSRLLVGSYRFKRFTDSCRKDTNGRSPLELAGAKIGDTDWLQFLIAHQH